MSLGQVLLGWLDDHTPEDVKAKMTSSLAHVMEQSAQSLFRILHYPPVADDAEAEAIRAAAHEDINLITLLLAGSRQGFGMDRHGEWHNVVVIRE